MTIDQIKKSGIISPGLINESTVLFLPTGDNKTYFIKHEGTNNYVKDLKGKYVKLPKADVLESRQKYLELYGPAEIEKAIEDEMVSLHEAVLERAKFFIQLIAELKDHLNNKFTNQELYPALKLALNREIGQNLKLAAETFFTEHPAAYKLDTELYYLSKERDYEALYQMVMEHTSVSLLSLRNNSGINYKGLHALFSNKELSAGNEMAPLYSKAKSIVHERYFVTG